MIIYLKFIFHILWQTFLNFCLFQGRSQVAGGPEASKNSKKSAKRNEKKIREILSKTCYFKIRWNHTHKLNKFGSKGQLLWRRETTITKFGSLLCLASPKCIFFRILIHCFIYLKCYWSFALKGIMEFWLHRPFTGARAMYFRENEASENPEFVWPPRSFI